MLSVVQSVLKIGFVKKGWIDGVGGDFTLHMAAVLAGCRRTLFGTGWTTSHLVSTKRYM